MAVIFAVLSWTTAEADEFASRTWHSDEGLPHNLVRAVAQTGDGYLWVGTRVGLGRFDGMRFTTFDTRNTPALKNSNISALCVDRDGTLWIGTFGGGLVRLKEGAFSHFGKEEGLVEDELSAFCAAKDGSLWIGTTSGLSRFQNGKFTHYGVKDGLASEIIRSVLEDRAGNLWIGTGLGLNRLRGDVMDRFTTSNGLPHNSIRGLLEDRTGRLWIGSNVGMTCYDGQTFRTYGAGQGLADSFVQTLCEDHRGNLWVGTYGGLARFRDGRFYEEMISDTEPFNLVNTLFEDREGDVWVGSREGLIRLIPKRFSSFTKRQGLSHDNVMCVEEDRSGVLWVGTWGGGLDELKGRTVTRHSTKSGFPHNLILSTCQGRDGSLWVGADFDGGLTRLKGDTLTHYTWRDGLINAAVRVLHEDRAGNLWIGTSKGLNCLRDGKFSAFTVTNNNLAGPVVRALCEDHLGQLWVGTEDGLSLMLDGSFTNFTVESGLSSSVILSLCEDAKGDLWIGTAGGGLDRRHNGHFTSYTTKEGLFSDNAFDVEEDEYGYFWISCLKGVARVRKSDFDAFDRHEIKSIAAVAYGRLDGLLGVVCNCTSKPSGWKCRDGRILFPTTKGLVAVDSTIQVNRTPPPVVIEQLVMDNRTMDLVAPSPANGGAIRWPTRHGAIQVPPGRGGIEIHYSALSLQLSEKNYFRYQLDGVDSDWVDAGSRRVAYYNNVAPGAYRFRVMACNNDGVWNEAPAAVVIDLLPHVWQTPWFRTLAALALAGGLAGIVRYISLRRLRRKLAALQSQHAIEKERSRIARDIHDDLGSRLTQITLLSNRSENEPAEEMRNSARKISATARDLAQSLDEIVWAVNPEHDTLEGLVEYLSQFADDFLEDTPIRSHLKLPERLPDCTIPAEARHQFFLAFKEAIHNAVKHGAASEIEIEVTARPGHFQIILADNGAGFDPASARAGGHGLKNMRQRLERVGGRFDLSSQPGRGTRVTLAIRLHDAATPPL